MTVEEREHVEISVKYAGFVRRAEQDIARARGKVGVRIPEDINYGEIKIISMEAREKLSRVRPATVGQAARIGGVNPSDISALLIHLRRREKL